MYLTSTNLCGHACRTSARSTMEPRWVRTLTLQGPPPPPPPTGLPTLQPAGAAGGPRAAAATADVGRLQAAGPPAAVPGPGLGRGGGLEVDAVLDVDLQFTQLPAPPAAPARPAVFWISAGSGAHTSRGRAEGQAVVSINRGRQISEQQGQLQDLQPGGGGCTHTARG